MNCCTATINPRQGVLLRCDRTAGHGRIPEGPSNAPHYDFHQDATWSIDAFGQVVITYRTVTS